MSKELSITNNRLYIAWGVVIIIAGIRLALIELPDIETRTFILYQALRDASAVVAVWLGLAMITEKEVNDEQDR